MKRILRRPAALAAVALLAVAGGVAYAATSGSNPRDALLNDAAKRLGVSADALRAALKGAAADQLDQAVKDGRLTRQQADRIKARIQGDDGPVPFAGPPPGAFGAGPGGPPLLAMGLRAGLDAAASYLGLSPADLRAQLAKGKTLADVAKAQGKDVDGLVSAIVDAEKSQLDQAVKDGRLTSRQRAAIEQDLTQRVRDVVEGKGPRFRAGGPCGPGGGEEPAPATDSRAQAAAASLTELRRAGDPRGRPR